MRIGIITHPLRYNFGGLLQAYALQEILRRIGHQPITLDPKPMSGVGFMEWLFNLPKKIAIKYILGYRSIVLLKDVRYKSHLANIMQYQQSFIDKYINKKEVADYDQLSEDDFDMLIVGSDQVWRPAYSKDLSRVFLGFAEHWNVGRISYAASFGSEEWEYSKEMEAYCKRLIQKFNAISVREKVGIELCKKHFGVDATHVLDPTMLLAKEDYVAIVNNTDTKVCSGKMLVYLLDENPDNLSWISRMSEILNMSLFRVNGKPETSPTAKGRIQPSVEQWLRGFVEAKFVLTDSFHACVFSIIFNKPFLVWVNETRGRARIESLLSMFNLQDKLCDKCSSTNINSLFNYNWTVVNERLNAERANSLLFLKDALNKKSCKHSIQSL